MEAQCLGHKKKAWQNICTSHHLDAGHLKLSMPQTITDTNPDNRVLPWIGISSVLLVAVMVRHCAAKTTRPDKQTDKGIACSMHFLESIVDKAIKKDIRLRMFPGGHVRVDAQGAVVLAGGSVEVVLPSVGEGKVSIAALESFCKSANAPDYAQKFWKSWCVESLHVKALCS